MFIVSSEIGGGSPNTHSSQLVTVLMYNFVMGKMSVFTQGTELHALLVSVSVS
jgi:hypothetical protein